MDKGIDTPKETKPVYAPRFSVGDRVLYVTEDTIRYVTIVAAWFYSGKIPDYEIEGSRGDKIPECYLYHLSSGKNCIGRLNERNAGRAYIGVCRKGPSKDR